MSRHYSATTSTTNTTFNFIPYSCHDAAVLFCDLSGYSQITAALANEGGAHVLSVHVNAYLERLLAIVDEFGGDVIKFAGDALIVVWTYSSHAKDTESSTSTSSSSSSSSKHHHYNNHTNINAKNNLAWNVLCAAQCALALQERAGEHAVEGTPYKFQIHVGLCAGPLESEIFDAATGGGAGSGSHGGSGGYGNGFGSSSSTTSSSSGGGGGGCMQRLYHYVGGDCMAEIGYFVDLAKAGETVASQTCLDVLEHQLNVQLAYQPIAKNSKTDTTAHHQNNNSSSSCGLLVGQDKNDGFGAPADAALLQAIFLTDALAKQQQDYIIKLQAKRQQARATASAGSSCILEEDFIHPSVLASLNHSSGTGGPTHIAQMRNLCVLFIAMTSVCTLVPLRSLYIVHA